MQGIYDRVYISDIEPVLKKTAFSNEVEVEVSIIPDPDGYCYSSMVTAWASRCLSGGSRILKGGFRKVRAHKGAKILAEPCPLSVKNCFLFGKFADSATLFALRCEDDCILACRH